MADYYNEIDPFAAAWLRELMKTEQIPQGYVDERPIQVVQPDDLRGFRQCHFFAGIGGWAYALRLAGWPDDLGVWTGSCPCQPFSSAGAQAGGHDPRDLWPVWFQLIAECRPGVVFGEQVEAAIGHGWLDRLCDDLEAENYAVGACGLPGPCVGAYDIRHRLWFVADCDGSRRGTGRTSEASDGRDTTWQQSSGLCDAGSRTRVSGWSGGNRWERVGRASNAVGDFSELADTDGGNAEHAGIQRRREHGLRAEDRRVDGHARESQRAEVGELGYANGSGREARNAQPIGAKQRSGESSNAGLLRAGELADAEGRGQRIIWRASRHTGHVDECESVGELGDTEGADWRCEQQTSGARRGWSGPTGASAPSFWINADWLPCSDGKARPVEPGTFPLASGVSARVGRLRGYGNAIKPQVAQVFIESYLDARGYK